MKKIILVLAIAFIGCSQQDDLPTPIGTTTITNSHNFEGDWHCYNWVVDDITGTEHHRKFMFFNQSGNNISVSLNNYHTNGSMQQLINQSNAMVDSNYFDESVNPIGMRFKGVITSDSTLMVYQYGYNSGVLDTSQIKEFIKE